jgi:hypothetical protein
LNILNSKQKLFLSKSKKGAHAPFLNQLALLIYYTRHSAGRCLAGKVPVVQFHSIEPPAGGVLTAVVPTKAAPPLVGTKITEGELAPTDAL